VTRPRDYAIVAVLLGAWFSGLTLFPHALEPGRSDDLGVRLNLFANQGDGRVTNDWFTSTAKPEQVPGGSLKLSAIEPGLLAISRALPVYPENCYELQLTGRVGQGNVVARVGDEEGTNVLAETSILASPNSRDLVLAFRTGPYRRVSVILSGTADAVFYLVSARIRRSTGDSGCAAP
jgi:hypothetical protein